MNRRPTLPQRDPLPVGCPVRGRWLALNSPASAVPSHGVHAYGQTYAIDLVHDPEDASRPIFGEGAGMRDPAEFPAFGQPVHSMIDGVVVRASGWRRDHRSRTSMPALLYLAFEGIVRSIGGPGFVVGNHVVVRGDDGVFAAIAHMRRGSLTVRAGDRVRAGDLLGECGNSGNTTEPHVHAQLMDHESFRRARGVPFAFTHVMVGDDPSSITGVPQNGQHLHSRAELAE